MKRTVQVQYKLDKDLIDRVRGLCAARKTAPEEALNDAMRDWLNKELGTTPTPKNARTVIADQTPTR
jgi:hypothetical protein